MALILAKTCTKLGLAGGAVYWSVQQGVWGTPEEGHHAMRRLSDAIVPAPEPIKEAMVKSEPYISDAWNKGTKVVFETLIEAPQTMGVYANHAGSAVTKIVTDTISDKK